LTEGIRSPASAGAARRQGTDAQVPAARAVGRADRPAISARLRAAAAAQDRGGSRTAAFHHDRNRHRLPAARAGLKRQSFTVRTRRALPITLTEESAIAAAPTTGESRTPKNG